MIAKRIAAAACALAMAFSLAGCAGAEGDQQAADGQSAAAASFADVTDDELTNAYYLMATQMPEETSMTGIYIMGNTENKTISGTFSTTAQDGSQSEVAAEAERLMRLYSKAVAEAALQEAKDAEDADAEARWQAVVDAEGANEDGPGGLYEHYAAVVTVQNDDNTLLVDGERAAGTDANWNWQ